MEWNLYQHLVFIYYTWSQNIVVMRPLLDELLQIEIGKRTYVSPYIIYNYIYSGRPELREYTGEGRLCHSTRIWCTHPLACYYRQEKTVLCFNMLNLTVSTSVLANLCPSTTIDSIITWTLDIRVDSARSHNIKSGELEVWFRIRVLWWFESCGTTTLSWWRTLKTLCIKTMYGR